VRTRSWEWRACQDLIAATSVAPGGATAKLLVGVQGPAWEQKLWSLSNAPTSKHVPTVTVRTATTSKPTTASNA
jgi:hypothetical protein